MELGFTELSYASYILLGIVALYVLIIILLLFVERYLRARGIQPNQTRTAFYKRQVEELENSTEGFSIVLEKMNKLARDYLKEAFDTDEHLEYSELAEYFKEKNKILIEHFCNEMVAVSYAGEYVDHDRFLVLLRLFKKIIEVDPIPSAPQETNKLLGRIISILRFSNSASGNPSIPSINQNIKK